MPKNISLTLKEIQLSTKIEEDKNKDNENNEDENKKDNKEFFKEPLPVNLNKKNTNSNVNNINPNFKISNKKYIPHIKILSDENKTKEPLPKLTFQETLFYHHSNPLQEISFTPQKYLSLCSNLFYYFNIYIPKVISPGPQIVISKYNSDFNNSYGVYQTLYNNLHRIPNVIKYLSLFKTIKCPDRKLVEYDSGKLIKLAELLKKLYLNKSKALIFTQMTRMLDILEIFLNIHGFPFRRKHQSRIASTNS